MSDGWSKVESVYRDFAQSLGLSKVKVHYVWLQSQEATDTMKREARANNYVLVDGHAFNKMMIPDFRLFRDLMLLGK